MEKLKPEYNFTDELKTKVESILSQLKQETPEAFEDGQINFDILKDLIGAESINDDAPEHFGLNWPGKRQARRLASLPPKGTLKPCIGEGVNEETTENIFIEGENLEVLKILRKSYKGKIKMIYIDPPYNTGNDMLYKDDFSEPLEDYLRKSGQKSEEGLLTSNPKSQGRFHSNWLNFIYPRLRIAKDLLKDDGVILVSIDDNEIINLKSLLNEVFGEENSVGVLVWEKKKKGAFLANDMTNIKEYIVVFAKKKDTFNGLIGEIAKQQETYPVIKTTNTRGTRIIPAGIPSKFKELNHHLPKGTRISSGNMELILLTDLIIKDGILENDVLVDSNWIYSQDLISEYAENKELYITQDLYFRRIVNDPRNKKLKDILPRVGISGEAGNAISEIDNLFYDGWGTNEDGNEELHKLLGIQNLFDYPKPSKLIAKLIASLRDPNAIILDFFAGSGTTAHSIYDLNSITPNNLKFICVQIPALVEEKSEAYKAGYRVISEICKERIKRVIAKIQKDNKINFNENNADFGFKVYKLDHSNIKEWQDVQPIENRGINLFSQLEQQNQEPIHENTKTEDLLIEFMLVEGFPLHAKISKLENVNGNTVFKIIDSEIPYSLFVCLDDLIQSSTVGKLQITSKDTFICLDRSFDGNDQVKMQLDDICKLKTV